MQLGLWAGIGTVCQVAVCYQVTCLHVISTHRINILPLTSVSKPFACNLIVFCQHEKISSYLQAWLGFSRVGRQELLVLGSLILLGFGTISMEGGDGNVEGKLGLIPTVKALGTTEMARSRWRSCWLWFRATICCRQAVLLARRAIAVCEEYFFHTELYYLTT